MNKDFLGHAFHTFENENVKELEGMMVYGFNVWQILKHPLYWKILLQDETQVLKDVKKESIAIRYYKKWSLQFVKLIDIFLLFLIFIKLFIQVRIKKNVILFYTNSADKLAKNHKGEYFNFLADSFIESKIVTNYVYAERSAGGRFKTPSPVKPDFKIDRLNILSFFLSAFYRKEKEVGVISNRLSKMLSTHLKREQVNSVVLNSDIENIFKYFYLEFQSAKVFLKIVRPSFIITSEQLGYGLLGAARKLGIRSIDLQHGIIDRFHPQYIFAPGMKSIKANLAVPTYVGVFGSLHKDILMHDGFWRSDEIIILGSSRIHSNRNRSEQLLTKSGNKKAILIPTQFTAFSETMILLKGLMKKDVTQFRIVVKLHPSEPVKNVTEYKIIASLRPDLIEIYESERDIYEAIREVRLVVGFDSAVLLEAISLYKPCVTLGTRSAPKGIHDFFWNGGELETVIRLINVMDMDALLELISKVFDDSLFYNKWIDNLKNYGNRLYAKDYIQNCKDFITMINSYN